MSNALASAAEKRGEPVQLALGGGSYELDAPLNFSSAMGASEVLLTAPLGSTVVLRPPSARRRGLQEGSDTAVVLSAGVLTLERIELRGWSGPAVAVSGGQLTLRHSVLAENAGQGAVRVTGGEVLIEDSTLEANTGGAIFASGGDVSLQRSSVTANSAARGGGVHVEAPQSCRSTPRARRTRPR